MSDPKAQTAEPTMEEILASIRRIISENDEEQEAKKPAEAAPAPSGVSAPEPQPAPSAAAAPAAPAPAPASAAPETPYEAAARQPEPAPADLAGVAVLELTEMVTEDGSVVSLTGAAEQTESFDSYFTPEPGETENAESATGEYTQTSDEHAGKADTAMENSKNDSVEFTPNTDTSRPSPEEGLVSAAAAAAATSTFAQLARSMAQEPSAAGNMPLGASNRTLEDLVKEMLRPMLKDWLDRNLPQMVEHMVRRELDRMTRKAEGL